MAALLSVAMVHFPLVLLECSITAYMATSSVRMMVSVGSIPHGAVLSCMSPSRRYAPDFMMVPSSSVFQHSHSCTRWLLHITIVAMP